MYTVFAYENVEDGPNPNAFLHNVGIAASNDGGVTWHDYPVRINPDITAKYDNQFVNVAVDKAGVVYVAYSDNHGIFVQYSTNHGQTFSSPRQVSQGTDTAVMPWLAAGDAGKVDLVYYQAVGYSGNPEVAPISVAWKVMMAQSLNAATTSPGYSYDDRQSGGASRRRLRGRRALHRQPRPLRRLRHRGVAHDRFRVDHLLGRPVPERREPQAERDLQLHRGRQRHVNVSAHERRDADVRQRHLRRQEEVATDSERREDRLPSLTRFLLLAGLV